MISTVLVTDILNEISRNDINNGSSDNNENENNEILIENQSENLRKQIVNDQEEILYNKNLCQQLHNNSLSMQDKIHERPNSYNNYNT